jgi:hypothetical protein
MEWKASEPKWARLSMQELIQVNVELLGMKLKL